MDASACAEHLRWIVEAGGSTSSGATTERLIAEFGDLPRVLASTPEHRLRASGRDLPAMTGVEAFRSALRHVLRFEVDARPVLSNWRALLDYLRADMAYRTTEQVRVLHLDVRNMLIRDEVMSEGTINESSIHVREVIRRALDFGSAGLILVHNHPSGDPTPSRADIELSRTIKHVGRQLGITMHDHLVIGTMGHASLGAMGEL